MTNQPIWDEAAQKSNERAREDADTARTRGEALFQLDVARATLIRVRMSTQFGTDNYAFLVAYWEGVVRDAEATLERMA